MKLHWRETRTAWVLRLPERFQGKPYAELPVFASQPRNFPLAEWLRRGLHLHQQQPVSFAVLSCLSPYCTENEEIRWRFLIEPYSITVSDPSF